MTIRFPCISRCLVSRSQEAGKRRLLAAGDPQIPKGDGDAPAEAYLTAMPGWKREVGRRIDRLVKRSVPDVRIRDPRPKSATRGVPLVRRDADGKVGGGRVWEDT